MNFILKQSFALVAEFTREERLPAIAFLESLQPADANTKEIIDALIAQLKMSLVIDGARNIH